jgi:hypothetical protein
VTTVAASAATTEVFATARRVTRDSATADHATPDSAAMAFARQAVLRARSVASDRRVPSAIVIGGRDATTAVVRAATTVRTARRRRR